MITFLDRRTRSLSIFWVQPWQVLRLERAYSALKYFESSPVLEELSAKTIRWEWFEEKRFYCCCFYLNQFLLIFHRLFDELFLDHPNEDLRNLWWFEHRQVWLSWRNNSCDTKWESKSKIDFISHFQWENIRMRDFSIEIGWLNHNGQSKWVFVDRWSTSFACWSIWFSIFSSKSTFVHFHFVKFWSEGSENWKKWVITFDGAIPWTEKCSFVNERQISEHRTNPMMLRTVNSIYRLAVENQFEDLILEK